MWNPAEEKGKQGEESEVPVTPGRDLCLSDSEASLVICEEEEEEEMEVTPATSLDAEVGNINGGWSILVVF